MRLILPDEKIIDSMSYIDAPKNQSYNKTNSVWQWSTILTPDAANIVATNYPEKATLQKPKKIDSNIINKYLPADIVGATNPIIGNSFNGANPWFLFLTALALTIVSAIIILILKLKVFGK